MSMLSCFARPFRPGASRVAARWRLLSPVAKLGALLCCALPLLATAAWYMETELRARAAAEEGADSGRTARMLAEETRLRLRTLDLAMQALRDRWQQDPLRFDTQLRALQRRLAHDFTFTATVVSATGQVLYGPRVPDVALRTSMAAGARDGDGMLSGLPFQDPQSRHWFLPFSRVLADSDGQGAGCIIMAVPVDYLAPASAAADIGPGGAYVVARADGHALARIPVLPKPLNAIQYALALRVPAEPAVLVESHVAQTDGVERLYAWTRVAGYPLVISVGRAHDAIFAGYYRQRMLLLAAFVALCGIIAGTGWYRLIVHPQRVRAAEALKHSELRLQFALEGARQVVWDWDMSTGDGYFSPRLADIVGQPAAARIDRMEAYKKLIHPDDLPKVLDSVRAHVTGDADRYTCEYRLRGGDGGWRWVLAKGTSAIKDRRGRTMRMTGVMSDITEARLAQDAERAYRLRYDPLTGLGNRAALLEDGEKLLAARAARGETCWALCIDLDRFQVLNDGLGHDAGDVLLRLVARRIQSAIGSSDVVARPEANRFKVLTMAADENTVTRLVRRMRQAIASPLSIGTEQYLLTCSVGIACFPSDGDTLDDLLNNARAAMRRAKDLGGNQAQFYKEAYNERTGDRLRIENALRLALDNGELALHYQPQVDLASGRIVGAEALLRWQHPELGMVPPDRFIPIAEEIGLINAFGRWALRQACAAAKGWHDAGHLGLRVGVNLSPKQFSDPYLVEEIAIALADTGLPGEHLDLEITESVVIGDIDSAVQTMWRMKMMGLTLSMDDFGTGFSSLSYLRRLPIDKLKIDRSFIAHVASDRRLAAITTSVITMAQDLDLSVVAEGVETAEQLDFLRAWGCDEIQGYYFSRPLPAQEFVALLEAKRALPARGVRSAA